MITLPHHAEFLSDRWLEAAGQWLDKNIPNRPELKGQPFSVSERFEDAPPHLELEDDVATWSVTFDGEKATVSRAFKGDADVVIEGVYQAALMAAQTVGAITPGVMARQVREINNIFGKGAISQRGQLGQGAAQVMGLLHDHMARMTVENPDIAHRARALGIADNVREVEEKGYTVLESAISPGFADEVREATLRALLPHHHFQLQWMLYHGVEFERLVQNPQLMTLIDASLGRGACIASISSIKKAPGPGVIPMHTDYSMVPEPYPEFAMAGVGVWALEDWTVDAGPTWIVPGSHKLRRGPKPGEQAEGVPIEMPKGSVVYFTHGVWHWQGDRTAPGDRVTIHSHFNRGILRGLEPKKVDVQMMHRNPPRLGEMLGEDDWFDKLSEHGRDQLRAGYMMKLHDFTNKRLEALLNATG